MKLFGGEGLLHQELLQQLLAGLGHGLADGVAVQLQMLLGGAVHVHGAAVYLGSGFPDHVHQTLNLITGHHGEGEGNHALAICILEGVHHLKEVGVVLVQLGDIEHGRQLGVIQIVPGLFGAHGDAALGGQADETGVHNPQRLGNFTGEGEVAGVVQNIDLAFIVLHRQNGGGDGIAALDLLGVEVADSIAVGTLAQTRDRLGREQHALAECGFAIAAVAKQADVADVIGSIAHSQKISFLQTGSGPASRQYTIQPTLDAHYIRIAGRMQIESS